jgi:prolipoprotein diacylglyceryltransferase
MHPLLFTVGRTPIWSHAVFTLLGVAVALTISWRIARARDRATQSLLWICSGGLMGAALLAKFGLAGRYLLDVDTPTLSGFLRWEARSLLGGLTGAYAGVVITKRLIGYPQHTGDLLTPGVAIGIAIGRIGCQLAETPGTATTLPWGVHVAVPVPPSVIGCTACDAGLAMHPSFLYESLLLVVVGLWTWPYARRGTYPFRWMGDGDLFQLFLLTYAIFRFAVEFVRGNPAMWWGLSGSQLTVCGGFVLLAWRLLRTYRDAQRARRAPAVPA